LLIIAGVDDCNLCDTAYRQTIDQDSLLAEYRLTVPQQQRLSLAALTSTAAASLVELQFHRCQCAKIFSDFEKKLWNNT